MRRSARRCPGRSSSWSSARRAICRGDLLFVHARFNPLEDPERHLAQTGRHAGGRHRAWIRDEFLDWREGWGGLLVIHGHTPALVGSGPHDEDAVSAALDRRADLARICLDAQAARRPRVAALQVAGPRYRLIVCDAGAQEVDPGYGFFAI